MIAKYISVSETNPQAPFAAEVRCDMCEICCSLLPHKHFADDNKEEKETGRKHTSNVSCANGYPASFVKSVTQRKGKRSGH